MTAEFGYSADREETSAAQVRALEALLIEKGIITNGTVDKVLGYFESEMTPLNGRNIVVKASTGGRYARPTGTCSESGGCYADVGIRCIMPTFGLCRD